MYHIQRKLFISIIALLVIMPLSYVFAGGERVNEQDHATHTQKSIDLLLDWVPNTNHIGAYVALHNKYFEEQGLEVHIISASHSSVETLVGNNNAEFGFSYQENTTFARASDTPLPIVAVAAVIQHNTSGFAAPVSKNITSPQDFTNKKYGAFGSPIEASTLDTIMAPYNTSSNDVTFIQAGALDFFQATKTDIYDFAWIFEGWTLVEAQLNNEPMYYLPLIALDEVFDYYTPIIISSEQYISDNFDTAQVFMHALQKGYEWAIDNPVQASEILLVYAPELDSQLVTKSLEFLALQFQADAEYWGMMKAQVWQRYTTWLQDKQFISKDFSIDGIFTNDLLRNNYVRN